MSADLHVPLCGAEDWRHTCHQPRGHHGRHACYGECDFTWPNEADIQPCTSVVVAVLGAVDGPTRLRCSLIDGHPDDHWFAIGWSDKNEGQEATQSARSSDDG